MKTLQLESSAGIARKNRRSFIAGIGALAGLSMLPYRTIGGQAAKPKLGLVTYLWGKDWSVDELIVNCEKSGLGAVELRTSHAHGVEPSLSPAARFEVKSRFANSAVKLLSLGTAEEFNHPEPERLQAAMDASREFLLLSRDVGAMGIKVRPNRLYAHIDHEKTIDQIGRSLDQLGRFALEIGQEIYLEVHGEGTSHLPVIKEIMDRVEAKNVGVCWNCNSEDLLDGGMVSNFNLVRQRLGRTLHVRELDDPEYPYTQLMQLLKTSAYEGWVLLECRTDPEDKIAALIHQRKLYEQMIG